MSESPELQNVLGDLLGDGPPGAEIVAYTIERVLREQTQFTGARREWLTKTIMVELAQQSEWVEQWLNVHGAFTRQGRVVCPDCKERFSPAVTAYHPVLEGDRKKWTCVRCKQDYWTPKGATTAQYCPPCYREHRREVDRQRDWKRTKTGPRLRVARDL